MLNERGGGTHDSPLIHISITDSRGHFNISYRYDERWMMMMRRDIDVESNDDNVMTRCPGTSSFDKRNYSLFFTVFVCLLWKYCSSF